jgi:hypothetical protein
MVDHIDDQKICPKIFFKPKCLSEIIFFVNGLKYGK